MIDIAENELEQLVGENARRIRKPKQRMVRKHGPQAHGPGVENAFVAQATQAAMSMHNLNALPDENVSENREEGKDGGKGSLAINYKKRHVVHLEPVGEISNPLSVVVRMRNNDDLVSSVYKLA